MQGTKFLAGVWGLESRARCAGFSVTEIGNRKERLRDYASFPDRRPKRNPKPRSDKKSGNQGAKRHLIPTKLLKTAASYIRNAAMVTPCRGWGYVPALQAGDALRWA